MIRVHPNTTDWRRYTRALARMSLGVKNVQDDLPRVQATEYVHLLTKNIQMQRHMADYPAYSKRYAEWKEKMGLIAKGYWRLYDSLLMNLAVWRVLTGTAGERAWKAGIPEGVTDKGGTSWFGLGEAGGIKPIAMYARTMELGEGHNKKRPIFYPTMVEYRDGKYPDTGEWALKRIAGMWR